MANDLHTLSIEGATRGLRAGEFSAEEITRACLDSADALNPAINGYLELFREQAVHSAREIDKKYSGESFRSAPTLAGIPLAIKDNILIEGNIASSASRMLERYRASYDATVISALKHQGAVFLGRTNMDEFAMGSSTENSAYGPTKNPHDHSRVPGGSSGGSAAVVAGHMALASLGSDTGGSIRQPASLCGIVGMKPTYGTVSRFGLMALASSLDQIGPFAKTVGDAEILFDAISAYDKNDSTNVSEEIRVSHRVAPLRKKIGVPFDALEKGLDTDVAKNFEHSMAVLKAQGYEIVPVSLPSLSYSLAVYYVIQPAETSANLARYDGVRYGLKIEGDSALQDYMLSRGAGFGPETRRRILLGTYVLSAGYYDAFYTKAVQVREMTKADFARAFADVDAIITPTTPSPAFKVGEKTSDPLAMYLEDIFTVPANIAGLPAMSVPSGFAEREGKQLPLGLQITTPHFREDFLFAIGKDFEAGNK